MSPRRSEGRPDHESSRGRWRCRQVAGTRARWRSVIAAIYPRRRHRRRRPQELPRRRTTARAVLIGAPVRTLSGLEHGVVMSRGPAWAMRSRSRPASRIWRGGLARNDAQAAGKARPSAAARRSRSLWRPLRTGRERCLYALDEDLRGGFGAFGEQRRRRRSRQRRESDRLRPNAARVDASTCAARSR